MITHKLWTYEIKITTFVRTMAAVPNLSYSTFLLLQQQTNTNNEYLLYIRLTFTYS